MLYSNKTQDDIAYKDIFDQAEKKINLKTIYALSNTEKIPRKWKGPSGYISQEMINQFIPDFKDRMFYISGPQAMVTSTNEILRDLGVPPSQIKKDFFPGFA